MKAMPVRYRRVEDFNKVKRQVFCVHYGHCLDHAIKKNWESFSCEQCQSFEDERPDVEGWIEDQHRCMRLLLSSSTARA